MLEPSFSEWDENCRIKNYFFEKVVKDNKSNSNNNTLF